MRHRQEETSYVLITAAHNEEAYIDKTLLSVVHQTQLPVRWIIVDDASEDGTAAIVRQYEKQYPFIELLSLNDRHARDFSSKVFALNAGAALLEGHQYAFVGHLDADVSFQPEYMSSLIDRLQADQKLGLAGGFIHEEQGGEYRPRPMNSVRSVAGAIQMFRRECYESLNGFSPLRYGGEDWHAEVRARMGGWRVVAFPELAVHHLRPTGSAGKGRLRYWYLQGYKDYSLGSHPGFEAVKMARRMLCRPYIIGALAGLVGFGLAYCRRENRLVSPEFLRFLRAEQMDRLRLFRSPSQ